MELFKDDGRANFTSTAAMVDEILRDLGHDGASARQSTASADDKASWQFVKGSARITVHLLREPPYARLRVESHVMDADDKRDATELFRKLLSINRELQGAAFAIDRKHVLLISERSTLDLDRSEVRAMIETVQDRADHYDDILVDEFGGRFGNQLA